MKNKYWANKPPNTVEKYIVFLQKCLNEIIHDFDGG